MEDEPPRPGRSRHGSSTAFGDTLDAEQADMLMRRTDQSAQWHRLRQKNDNKARELTPIILARQALWEQWAEGKSINWQSFDQLTSQLHQAGLDLPDSTALLAAQADSPPSPSSPRPVQPAAAAQTLVDEDNLLLLSLSCPAIGLKREIVGYGDGRTTLLPLGDVAHALGFELTVHPDRKTASGWFISEDRPFFLDADNRTVRLGTTTMPWPEGAVAVHRDEIFVDSALLSRWLPVDFSVTTGEMAVTVTPREKLPQQSRYEREQQRLGLLAKEDMTLRHIPVQSPYESFSFPVMDINLGSGFERNRQDDGTLRLGHSLLAEGDLARMGARLFLSGDEDDPLDNGRITLERVNQGGQLLGPMRASRLALGDVSPVTLPILGSRTAERGVAIESGDIRRNRDFDVTQFEGNAQPGWDVELYQNGNLVDSVRVGDDGRYRFKDIPVFFGANAFQLLAHGPQGQRRMIETKNINVGSGMLRKGEAEYSLSATQRKNTVLGIDEHKVRSQGDGERLVGRFTYGLTDALSASLGTASVEFDQTRHTYLQAGLSGTFASLYGEANAIQDSAGGSGYSFQAQTAWGPVNLRAKQELFSDFVDEDNPDRVLKARTTVGINGSLADFAFLPPLTYTLSRENTTYEGSETGRTSGRLAAHFNRVHLANVLHVNDRESGDVSTPPAEGEFQASGTIGRGRLTGGLAYDLGDDAAITEYKLSGLWPIVQGISAGASLNRDVDMDDPVTRSRAFLNFDNGRYTLSPSLTYDSDGNYGVFVGLSFSLGKDPASEELVMQSQKRSGRGATTAFVYHDANNNQVFDQDETPLPDVKVVARQARQNVRTDESGFARFTGLTAHEPVDFEIDARTLEDPFWQPSVPGKAVIPRSGNVHTLEFPVVTTGEIDGAVYGVSAQGSREPLARVGLEVRNEEGDVVQKTTSEGDGFFLFEKLLPGTYTLHVTSDDPRLRASTAAWQKTIVIGNDGTIARGNDVLLPLAESGQQDRTGQATHFVPAASGSMTSSGRMVAEPAAGKPTPAITRQQSVPTPTPVSPAPSSPAPPTQAKESIPPAPARAATITIAPLTVMQHAPKEPAAPGPAESETVAAVARRAASLAPADASTSSPTHRVAPQPSPGPPTVRQIRPALPRTGTEPLPVVDQPAQAPNHRQGDGQHHFTVHLASFSSPEGAAKGIQILAKRLAGMVTAEEMTVTPVDLGPERGTFYRVTCGRFGTRQEANQLATRLRTKTDHARSMPIQTPTPAQANPIANDDLLRPAGAPSPRMIAQTYAAMQRRAT